MLLNAGMAVADGVAAAKRQPMSQDGTTKRRGSRLDCMTLSCVKLDSQPPGQSCVSVRYYQGLVGEMQLEVGGGRDGGHMVAEVP
jgi:hypothetical protein